MPRRTHGEKIDELSQSVATLNATVDFLGNQFDRLESRLESQISEQRNELKGLVTEVAVLKQRVTDWKDEQQRSSYNRWLLIAQFGGAIVTVALSGLLSFLISRSY